ncbi:MAG: N-acetyltransferase family protein, partial [Chlorobi bacterium]|nr:N-acetyltransferase family protein [Chlorobiota bacterium]
TFEKTVPSWVEWNKKYLLSCSLVCELNKEIIGWAGVSPVSQRGVYKGVAEVSIYVSPSHQNKGLGKQLLFALIDESERGGIWMLQASIFPENTASISLHKACGFRKVGIRRKIGFMDGRWRDTILLERRSKVIGV